MKTRYTPVAHFITLFILASALFLGCHKAHAATIATNLPAFPPVSSLFTATNLLPTVSSLGQHIEVRAGYGYNTATHTAVEAAAVDYELAPSLSIGGVFYRDNWGIASGGVTMSINGSINAPLVGELDFFGGDGLGYDFRFHKPVNYLFTGIEKPFKVSVLRLAPGVSLVNTSDRPGTAILGGLSFTF
jgi:hypothetical protein